METTEKVNAIPMAAWKFVCPHCTNTVVHMSKYKGFKCLKCGEQIKPVYPA